MGDDCTSESDTPEQLNSPKESIMYNGNGEENRSEQIQESSFEIDQNTFIFEDEEMEDDTDPSNQIPNIEFNENLFNFDDLMDTIQLKENVNQKQKQKLKTSHTHNTPPIDQTTEHIKETRKQIVNEETDDDENDDDFKDNKTSNKKVQKRVSKSKGSKKKQKQGIKNRSVIKKEGADWEEPVFLAPTPKRGKTNKPKSEEILITIKKPGDEEDSNKKKKRTVSSKKNNTKPRTSNVLGKRSLKKDREERLILHKAHLLSLISHYYFKYIKVVKSRSVRRKVEVFLVENNFFEEIEKHQIVKKYDVNINDQFRSSPFANPEFQKIVFICFWISDHFHFTSSKNYSSSSNHSTDLQNYTKSKYEIREDFKNIFRSSRTLSSDHYLQLLMIICKIIKLKIRYVFTLDPLTIHVPGSREEFHAQKTETPVTSPASSPKPSSKTSSSSSPSSSNPQPSQTTFSKYFSDNNKENIYHYLHLIGTPKRKTEDSKNEIDDIQFNETLNNANEIGMRVTQLSNSFFPRSDAPYEWIEVLVDKSKKWVSFDPYYLIADLPLHYEIFRTNQKSKFFEYIFEVSNNSTSTSTSPTSSTPSPLSSSEQNQKKRKLPTRSSSLSSETVKKVKYQTNTKNIYDAETDDEDESGDSSQSSLLSTSSSFSESPLTSSSSNISTLSPSPSLSSSSSSSISISPLTPLSEKSNSATMIDITDDDDYDDKEGEEEKIKNITMKALSKSMSLPSFKTRSRFMSRTLSHSVKKKKPSTYHKLAAFSSPYFQQPEKNNNNTNSNFELVKEIIDVDDDDDDRMDGLEESMSQEGSIDTPKVIELKKANTQRKEEIQTFTKNVLNTLCAKKLSYQKCKQQKIMKKKERNANLGVFDKTVGRIYYCVCIGGHKVSDVTWKYTSDFVHSSRNRLLQIDDIEWWKSVLLHLENNLNSRSYLTSITTHNNHIGDKNNNNNNNNNINNFDKIDEEINGNNNNNRSRRKEKGNKSTNRNSEIYEQLNQTEEDEFRTKFAAIPIPASLKDMDNHPLFILENKIGKYFAVYPEVVLGHFKTTRVFLKQNLHQLHSREGWIQQGMTSSSSSSSLNNIMYY